MPDIEADLFADIVLYATDTGGKTTPARPGFRCSCMVSKVQPLQGWDARLLLEQPLFPGQRRRVEFCFLSREGALAIRTARHFFLWEGRFVGEAVVCSTNEME